MAANGNNVEIERKFLVRELPVYVTNTAPAAIRQGYITRSGDSVEVRLREKAGRFYQTVKSKGGKTRTEVELSLTKEQFDELWPLTAGRQVEKKRYVTEWRGFIIETDVYEGRLAGLLTAEVEFGSEEESAGFTPPEWFAEELTEDQRYKNRILATNGLPEAFPENKSN